MVHTASTLQPQSIRLQLALSAMHGFDIWTSDVHQSYLQSAAPLARDIFIDKLAPKFKLEQHQCLQLLKPLYGLCVPQERKHEAVPFRPALYRLMVDCLFLGLSGATSMTCYALESRCTKRYPQRRARDLRWMKTNRFRVRSVASTLAKLRMSVWNKAALLPEQARAAVLRVSFNAQTLPGLPVRFAIGASD